MNFPAGKAYSKGFEPIGYIGLEDRPGFKMALHKAGDRWYLYVAQFWCSGWSIVEVTDPRKPRFVRYIAGPPNTWTLQVQTADNRMVTSMERIPPGWGDDGSGKREIRRGRVSTLTSTIPAKPSGSSQFSAMASEFTITSGRLVSGSAVCTAMREANGGENGKSLTSFGALTSLMSRMTKPPPPYGRYARSPMT